MSRLPHQIMAKKQNATRDVEFIQHENHFNETMKLVDTLKVEAQAFRDQVAVLLSNQYDIASLVSGIYGLSLETSEPVQDSALQAVNDAEAAMAYCQDEILPQLDTIDQLVVRPALELHEISKTIQKTIVKRNHKMVDYDRHRASLNKLTSKTERSMNDEKAIFKIQSQLETATQDYEYLNNTLKHELPIFFQLLSHLVQPILENLYHLQTKIYGMIYARCYELMTANQQHFVTQGMDIQGGYQWRLNHYNGQAEMEKLDLLHAKGKAWLNASGSTDNSKFSLQERAALKNTNHTTASHAANDETIRKYVVALYDYDALAEGDLSFRKDDKIELVNRTQDANDWWTGKLRGQTGVFPGNYVQEI
ncbi:unnamed protein product [Rhizopus microsporus]